MPKAVCQCGSTLEVPESAQQIQCDACKTKYKVAVIRNDIYLLKVVK